MSKSKFYRTNIAGLSVHVGDPEPEKGIVAPKRLRFSAYVERFRGDEVEVGYLETDDEVAIKKLSDDINVEEISEKEYKEATDTEKGAIKAVL